MRDPLLASCFLMATLFTAGCSITSDKHGDGDNVKIATPFGGMSVKTDEGDVLAGIGLPLYPGASLVKKDKNNNNSADVNMSFGSFQLRVKAVEYRTPDSPQKVSDFYKKALGRFGGVLQCQDDQPVGNLVRTPEGLTCDDEHHSGDKQETGVINHGLSNFNGGEKGRLKAGSKKHQHIVDIDPDGSGTKFGLVALDLPLDFHFGDGNGKQTGGDNEDKEKDKQ